MSGGALGVGAIVAALISAAVAFALWLANARREAGREARRRRERAADVRLALRAEILAHAWPLEAEDLDADLAAMRARIEAEPGFFPFVPREPTPSVYAALVGEIHLLPMRAVGPVVAFYAQTDATGKFAEDLRDRRVSRLDAERRATLYGDFIQMKAAALRLAREAVAALDSGAQ